MLRCRSHAAQTILWCFKKPFLCRSSALPSSATRMLPLQTCSHASLASPARLPLAPISILKNVTDRSHLCGKLSIRNEGESVILYGWVHTVRSIVTSLGKNNSTSRSICDNVKFVVLRDYAGTVQLVFEYDVEMPKETVIRVEGVVRSRGENVNKHMSTGEIEVLVKSAKILNEADLLPFTPATACHQMPVEEVRMQDRHIDLRREEMQTNLRKRSLASFVMREFLVKNEFIEVETPILFKSTPEGAREFLVPSRQKGKFYALPQSPQQYKQMLMASGIDRYFQFARCFRDEALRIDRQLEFTQVDMELSFATSENIIKLVEEMINTLWTQICGKPAFQMEQRGFRRMSYDEAMRVYGSDKPDTRYDMKIVDVTNLFPEARVPFECDSVLEAMVIPGGSSLTKAQIAKPEANVPMAGQKRSVLGQRRVRPEDVNNSSWIEGIAKQVQAGPVNDRQALTERLNANSGDTVVMAWREKRLRGGSTLLGRARIHYANLLQRKELLQIPSDRHDFLWIVDFPLFSPVEDGPQNGNLKQTDASERRLESTHHPFTAPMEEDLELMMTKPENVRGQHYDLVLNGAEIGGGSIRIHNAELQERVFKDILKLTDEQTSQFTHLLKALRSGCPPHGGIAIGFDRLMSIVCNTSSIREVIAFPKTASGRDPVIGSPSEPSKETLDFYGIQRLDGASET